MRRYERIDFSVQCESNRLKKQPIPGDRFNDLDRVELAGRLERLADVRRNVVARGRALIDNPDYPDKETLRAIGRVLAQHLHA